MKFQAILATALLCLASTAHAADCGPLALVNEVQMERHGSRDYIPLKINGSDQLFLFDTGGVTTMIGRETAQALKLPMRQGELEFYDLLGNISRDEASVSEFTLGHMRGKDFNFPVAPMTGLSGIFSLNFMLPYDVDADFSNDMLKFFDQKHCEGGVVYWKASTVAVLPITRQNGHMTIPATLDGRTYKAIIDTGAEDSTLRMDIAQRSYNLVMGSPDTPESDTLNGDKDLKVYSHILRSLTFGDISVNNPHISIIPDVMKRKGDIRQQTGNRARLLRDEIVGPEMIIGMNVLRRLHIYMAFGERKMYISPASAPGAQ